MKTANRKPLGEKNIDTTYASPRARSGKTLKRLIPFAMILVFGLFILKDQVPGISDKIDSIISPTSFAAVQTCRNAALKQSTTPDFARLIKTGKAHSTEKGFFIDHLVIGEMDEQGGERRVDVSCHVEQSGALIKLNRTAHKTDPNGDENTDNYEEIIINAD
jgi:hypothetical protein